LTGADGSGLRRLTEGGGYRNASPSFSPDGKKIVFRRLLSHEESAGRLFNSEVWVMNADGSGLERAVASPYTDVRPQFLPDGPGIVFNREHDGRIELWRVPLPRP